MTPQEKAKDLLSKMDVIHYIKLGGKYSKSKGLPISMYDSQVKQCALIAVDEIKKSIRWSSDFNNEQKNYWQEVKQEIEKL